jgi:hypothetical protein
MVYQMETFGICMDPLDLTSRLQMISVGCYARHEYDLDTETWTASTTGLLELCRLFESPSFAKERRAWDQVITAHLTIRYGYERPGHHAFVPVKDRWL